MSKWRNTIYRVQPSAVPNGLKELPADEEILPVFEVKMEETPIPEKSSPTILSQKPLISQPKKAAQPPKK